ncbi:MAG: hypothetical protein UR81_C0025G0011, partial [Candidatus Levybacteria bacterium GW2011_GWB1_35_5]
MIDIEKIRKNEGKIITVGSYSAII